MIPIQLLLIASLCQPAMLDSGFTQEFSHGDNAHRLYVTACDHEANLCHPHSEKSVRTIFRRHSRASFGQSSTIGNVDSDGLQLDVTLHEIAAAAPCSKPHEVSRDGRRLFVYQLNNAAADEMITQLHDKHYLDDFEKHLVLMPECVTNSVIVAGMTDGNLANFSSLVQRLDERGPVLVANVIAHTKNGDSEIVQTKLQAHSVDGLFQLTFGAVQKNVWLRFEIARIAR